MVAWLWKLLHKADVLADWVVPGGEDKLQVGHSKATHHPANSFSIPNTVSYTCWAGGWERLATRHDVFFVITSYFQAFIRAVFLAP